MKKQLVAALASIEAQIEAAASTTDWAKTDVVEETDGQRLVFIKADALDDILTEVQVAALVATDIMYDEGVPEPKKAGRRTVDAYCIDMDALTDAARTRVKEGSEVVRFRKQIRELQRELKLAQESVVSQRALDALMETLTAYYKSPLATRKKSKNAVNPFKTRQKVKPGRIVGGVPTLMLSDLHYGEFVDPAQVEYVNEYNEQIADRRLSRVFSEFLNITQNVMNFDYDGVVVVLGGDMTSGSIHEELSITNWATDYEAVLKLADKISQGILAIADAFPCVYVPCVVGNHGRDRKKPYAKLKVKMNKDYLLYEMIQRIVGLQVDNVQFDIQESADLRYNVYDTRYLLTHGDQFPGPSGNSGLFASLSRIDHKKRARGIKTGHGIYDYVVMGHFHTYGALDGIIVNGSLKGMDEYAWNGNFGFEPAIQAMWFTHPTYGVTLHMPIYGDEVSEDDSRQMEPITRVTYLNGQKSIARKL